MKKIAVFTSGGDSPGMNACIRAVVRAAHYYELEPYGISGGYEGMIDGEIELLTARDVSYIIDRGGTFLYTARSQRFRTKEGRAMAFEQLKKHGIEAIVAIGGDGTFTGAQIFSSEYNIPIIGIPGTIDNDLFGTDATLGFDTATNTAMAAIDKIRDTATSHNRLFLVEVMGRDAGNIALRCGIATGAIGILIPEREGDFERLVSNLHQAKERRKKSNIVVIAEGETEGGALEIGDRLKEIFPDFDMRITILGHIQRGGSPTAFDRVLAARMGVKAIEALLDGECNKMVGLQKNKMVLVPIELAVKERSELGQDKIRMSDILSS